MAGWPIGTSWGIIMEMIRDLVATDVDALQALLESVPSYSERVTGYPPGPPHALSALISLPPSLDPSHEQSIGLWEDGELVVPRILLPEPPVDNAVRFDLALAATRFGRGADVIGLHLTLRVVREALVHSMVLADRRSGSVHHRSGSATDAAATRALALLSTGPVPALTIRVAQFSAESRALIDQYHQPDRGGLAAVIGTPTSGSDSEGGS